jgi:hypothetical protein
MFLSSAALPHTGLVLLVRQRVVWLGDDRLLDQRNSRAGISRREREVAAGIQGK